MDPNAHIYRAPEDEIPAEDKARLESYLNAKAEEGELVRQALLRRHDLDPDGLFDRETDAALVALETLNTFAQDRDRADRYEYALSLLLDQGGGSFLTLTSQEQEVVVDAINAAVSRRGSAAIKDDS